jgi:hypothetical protein
MKHPFLVLAASWLKTPLKCVYKTSVKIIHISELADDGKTTFTWNKLVKAYGERPDEFTLMSLYLFAAMSFITKKRRTLTLCLTFLDTTSTQASP